MTETKPGSGLCKQHGTIALFGNVVYSGLLNEHIWHFGVPLVNRLRAEESSKDPSRSESPAEQRTREHFCHAS
ncbi:hypothetical protein J4Q44_G00275290 [Coregonus suidteri]|uniref:Uncharacterized protein n=1 Tax=Coregonus suidteri TaxID=861788 RepID=A0AAN8QJY7_9TELE